jgi:uncharacterized membrane protein YhaH (DUF805 family)
MFRERCIGMLANGLSESCQGYFCYMTYILIVCFVLFNVIVAVVLSIIDVALGTFSSSSNIGLLSGIYSLAVIIPTLALSVRLHDTDRTGW